MWTREHITKNFTTVFCDTGWEHPLTYEYINRIADKLHLDLVTLKSKKYDGMVDLARQKKRWPSTRARFCTEELKTKPTIDYVLDEVQDNMLMIQGIRGAESPARAKMSAQCTYFKYYFEPYGYDKNGKLKKHTYRSKDVRAFREKFADDLLRPVFDWSAQQVIDSILAAGLEPNPLYRMGYKRVGCWPCVMANQRDILNIARQAPERIAQNGNAKRRIPGWDDFPTESPVCDRNDGFPGELADLSFPAWCRESIKACGNAIVPQVALHIFETINKYENYERSGNKH